MTYAEYRGWCERAAAGLAARGVAEGTRVSWVLPSRFEAFVLVGALARLGAVQNPILPIYRHRELAFIARAERVPTDGRARRVPRCRLREAGAGGDRRPRRRGARRRPRSPRGRPRRPLPGPPCPTASTATRCAGSSTRRAPSPIRRARATPTARWPAPTSACSGRWRSPPTTRSRWCSRSPTSAGLVWMFNAMETGCELLVVEIFSPDATPAFLAEHGVTCAGAGTVFWQAYLAAQRAQPGTPAVPRRADVQRRRRAEAAHHPRRARCTRWARRWCPGWGLTETPIVTMLHVDDPDERKATTEGRACPGVELRTVDPRRCGRRAGRRGRAAGARPAAVSRVPRLEPRRRGLHDRADEPRRRHSGARLVPHRRPRGDRRRGLRHASPAGSRTSSSARARTSPPRRSRTSSSPTRRWRTSR